MSKIKMVLHLLIESTYLSKNCIRNTMNSYLIKKYRTIVITGYIKENSYCIIESIPHGLFACFYCILYGLYICEMEDLKPIILLDNKHLYFDKKRGNNVFEYFYRKNYRQSKKIDLSNVGKITISDPGIYLGWCRVSNSEKIISNLLINKYFSLRTPIFRFIENFCTQNFEEMKVLGVHFRGKDKIKETPLISFDAYENKIDLMLKANVCQKIFFATDELHLKKYVKNKYRDKVILYNLKGFYKNDEPTKGLHFVHETPYLSALDALIECYILSRCLFLLSSSKSSMSLFATFFNPGVLHLIIEP